ncbi:MAG: hydantoinase/oxoprolinase family protein [Actinomycetota bacterium]
MAEPADAGGGLRIGADVGGTFTDIVVGGGDLDGFLSTKVLTTHDAPEVGILDGIRALAAEHGVDLARVEQVIHGTTLATNALIERTGARTALVTTEGFRDVIETRTEGRFEQYDLQIVLPTPLIERRDRFVIPERRNARGEELLAFDEASATEVIDRLVAGGYRSVAVGFLHSYRNPVNELRFRDLLAERAPDIAVSISAEVSPQMREFERFNTVCANAYVQPLMAGYLRRLATGLADLGIDGALYLIHSGGGLISVDTAVAFPVRLVESGPAGGAIFAADLAARHGLDRIVSYDMGGTTAKIALIEDRVPKTAKSFEVARTSRFKKGSGMPISIPVIEMIEIGAGGGSIASVDALGQIQVGPRSAGSEPGPAAYDRGGTEPTVTDANLALGRLHPDTFGAPGIELSEARAAAALDRGIGEPLGLETRGAAIGVAEMVDENMTNAARVHAVENGTDLGRYSMIAFGGGAPLHAARLMDKLGIEELLIPRGAGVGSAIGFLLAPFSYEAIRSFYTSTASTGGGRSGSEPTDALAGFDIAGAARVLDELTTEATGFVRRGTDAPTTVERQVSMRYRGQGWEIPVTVPDGPFDRLAAEALLNEFTKTYERFFGRAIDGLAIEAVSWAVRVASVQEPPPPATPARPGPPIAVARRRPIHDPAAGGADGATVEAAIVPRDGLSTGDTVAGPAVIVEAQTSTVLGTHHLAVVQGDGTLRITRTDSITRTDRTTEEARP